MRSLLDWLACTFVRAASGCFCRLPAPAAVWIGERLGVAVMWLQPKRVRIGLANVRAAFDGAITPAEAHRIIRGCFRQLGASFVELLRLPVMDRAYIDRYVEIEGRQYFEQALASGRPVIFLTGHYGNWELSSITAALMGYPITALARAQDKFPRLYRLLVSYRESKGCRIVHKGGAMKRLLTALGAGQLIGIVGDQASRQGIFVDFFGRPALFATGPFDLAYSREALILPAFIRRVRGARHQIVVEPPLKLDRQPSKERAIRAGIEWFASALERHIRSAPDQWLWMHKRWKHTPARRVIVLSDGKLGHLKQSLAVVEAMRARAPLLTHTVVEIRYRSPDARAAALVWSWWLGGRGARRCLSLTLAPSSAQQLLSRYADVVISCGSSLAPANLLWSAENRAKSVVIMNPAPLPLSRFDLVIAPRHDGLPDRANVVPVIGAIASGTRELPAEAAARLSRHPRFRPADAGRRHRVVAVFIGGDTAQFALGTQFAEDLLTQVQTACEAADGWFLVTTSRRTAPPVERRLAERLARDPRCRLLLLASRDELDGTMDGMLGSADVSIVTGESISMVSEACASGRHVVVVEPPLRPNSHGRSMKHQRFLRELARDGFVTLTNLPELGLAIRRALAARTPPKRLDNLEPVREVLGKII